MHRLNRKIVAIGLAAQSARRQPKTIAVSTKRRGFRLPRPANVTQNHATAVAASGGRRVAIR